MTTERTNSEELLLDYHLDRLDATQRAWIESELNRDASLAEKSRQLGHILKPLDYWQPAAPTEHLAERILAQARRGRMPSVLQMPPDESSRYRPRFLPARELVAVAACVLLLVGFFIPGLSSMRDRSQRAACANNLSKIFAGTSVYREYAGEVRNAAWLPSAQADRAYASNSRHGYLLIKQGFGPRVEDFICPADKNAVPMVVDDYVNRDDFERAANVSYDALNLTAGAQHLRPRRSLVYMGDPNPLFKRARFDASVNPDTANSLAHGSHGQTLLLLDGSAQWVDSPVVGPTADNIWLAGDIRNYTGTESRASADDVQLIPGIPVTDPDVQR